MAALAGCMLGAEKVFDFSGQFNLYKHGDVVERYPLLRKHKDDRERAKYYDIVPFLEKTTVPIFYFYPVGSKQDCVQAELVKGIKNIYPFAIDSNIHGSMLKPENYKSLFFLSSWYLIKLNKIFRRPISKELFYAVTTGGLMDSFNTADRLNMCKENICKDK